MKIEHVGGCNSLCHGDSHYLIADPTTAHGEPRCPHVAASPWGPARCVLPEGHTGRHAYGATEGES